MSTSYSQITKKKRQLRVRGKLFGTSKRPRLTVHRTNKHIYVQAIDDERQVTLISANDKQIKSKKKLTKLEKSGLVGELVADKLKKAKLKQVIFDRGSFRYHGRVKMIAETLRKQGIKL